MPQMRYDNCVPLSTPFPRKKDDAAIERVRSVLPEKVAHVEAMHSKSWKAAIRSDISFDRSRPKSKNRDLMTKKL
jgi:hypothetical protein